MEIKKRLVNKVKTRNRLAVMAELAREMKRYVLQGSKKIWELNTKLPRVASKKRRAQFNIPAKKAKAMAENKERLVATCSARYSTHSITKSNLVAANPAEVAESRSMQTPAIPAPRSAGFERFKSTSMTRQGRTGRMILIGKGAAAANVLS